MQEFDIGTSGCKLLVYDLERTCDSNHPESIGKRGRHGFIELNPGSGSGKCQDYFIRSRKKLSTENIEVLAVASLGESVVCLDENNNILAN